MLRRSSPRDASVALVIPARAWLAIIFFVILPFSRPTTFAEYASAEIPGRSDSLVNALLLSLTYPPVLVLLMSVLGTSDPTRDTATQASVSQIFAAFAAILVSNHLDTYGKKNIIRCACVVLCSVYIFYAFTTSFMQCLVLVTFYGIGNGIYLAADFSMAVDALPDPSKRARDMGLWGVAAFIGCMLGPCIGGPLLELFGHTLAAPSTVHDARYARSGFVILMLSGCLWSFLSALTLRFVTVGEPVQPKVLDQETD
jgi:MFS family permease